MPQTNLVNTKDHPILGQLRQITGNHSIYGNVIDRIEDFGKIVVAIIPASRQFNTFRNHEERILATFPKAQIINSHMVEIPISEL